MHDLALGDLRRHAGLHCALEDAPEALGAPALADAGQRRMVGQRLVQPVAHEPADREVDLRLPHQPPVMHDPEQEARQHQPDRDLRIDPRPAVRLAIEVGDLRSKPRQVEHAIHPGEDMVVGNELPQRPCHEQLQLIALLPSQHRILHRINDCRMEFSRTGLLQQPPRPLHEECAGARAQGPDNHGLGWGDECGCRMVRIFCRHGGNARRCLPRGRAPI